jgi:organic hydroperoxide reductase OsmC/OhrA
VISYGDDAEGELQMSNGTMRMTRVTLRPRIVLGDRESETKARELVQTAHAHCFIANSVTAEIAIEPRIAVAPPRTAVEAVEIG